MNTVPRSVSFGMVRPKPVVSKHRNQPTVVDNIRFDSKKEAGRYLELKLLLSAGRIRDFRRQVTYRLEVNGVKVCSYRCDFRYEEYAHEEWKPVTEDVKGRRGGPAHAMFLIKKHLMKAVHGIDVKET